MDTKEAIDNPITAASKPVGMSDTARVITLVIGDVLVFLIFAAIGRRSHGEAAGLSSILLIALTAAPFAIGWFVVSPLVGAFKRAQTIQPGKMAKRTALAWLASWPVGLALRGIFVDHAIPPWTFALITLVTNMIFLQIWRVPFAWVVKARGRVH
jgi:Protein of unknown function (DUF3054)